MTKAISTVIASILMLMIVIALGGTTYLYISGTLASKTATIFEVIDSFNDTVTIRNSGTESITSITATLDGNTANIAVVPNIQGLIAYWSMNEGSGTKINDNSGKGNDGTLNNIVWVDGKFGKALSFDGSITSWVNVNPNAINGLSDFTVEYWMKTSDATKSGTPVHGTNGGNNEFIGPFNYRSAEIYVKDSSWGTGVALNDGQWKHIIITRNGGTGEVRLYVDGVPRGSATLNTGVLTINCFVFGQEQDSSCGGFEATQAFLGILDEVGVFNRVLLENEISTLSSGLVSSGQLATIKPLIPLSKGTHTLKLCTSSMCNTAILTII
ncbi:MAG: hypothetical protein HYS80_01440 [Candidatus Aenigmarchaeota archaeon]|nr:hypothetical protein [Candidatus Aenigmarchaeota archaeon]